MTCVPRHAALFLTWVLLAGGARARAADAPAAPPPVASLAEGLRLGGESRGARSLLHEDAVEAAIVAGTWRPPTAGDSVTAPDGSTRTWERVEAVGTPPVFEGEAWTGGAYLSCRVVSPTEHVALLRAKGNDFVYVNGELRPGDPYGYGWLRLPVLLRAGENEFLFRVSRGRLEASLEVPPAAVFVLAEDATLPTCEAGPSRGTGGRAQAVGAVVVVNARASPVLVGLTGAVAGATPVATECRPVPPLSLRKLPMALPSVPPEALEGGEATLVVTATVRERTDPPTVPGTPTGRPVEIRWRGAAAGAAVRRRTFVSDVDGSVQYYATCGPPAPATGPAAPPRALVLSLHGASVEAAGQAAAYAPKPWATIVCPTNRRPFGFDWEDWGRLDALEVLGAELATGAYDASRVHVTGHSMGGHGAWHLGVTCPDLFATVCPSAGWVSFASYGGAPTGEPSGPAEELLRRGGAASDTLALADNLAAKGVYVLHGDADDNVPVAEARAMVERLKGVVADLHVHEQAGAGHWWDASRGEPGTDCVDWAPMFDVMARRRVPSPQEVREVDFTTASPGVSSRCAWVEVLAQERMLRPSRVRLRLDPGPLEGPDAGPRLSGTTENVLALRVDPGGSGRPVRVSLDGSPDVVRGHVSGPSAFTLVRRGGAWAIDAGDPSARKRPTRYGPFKEAFRHRFVLVVGTTGTPEESAWAARKARLDAETWWYRGNGTADVMDDREFVARTGRPGFPAGNVILYGHADMNAAWAPLLGDGPVRVGRGTLRVGDHVEEGDGLACLFLRPRPGSWAGLVGVVAGTGLPGLRLTDRLPYLASGVAVPDLVVLSTSMLTSGAADGLVGAGFFGPDWSVASGEFAWRRAAPPTAR